MDTKTSAELHELLKAYGLTVKLMPEESVA